MEGVGWLGVGVHICEGRGVTKQKIDSTSRAPEDIALGYLRRLWGSIIAFFAKCWRGECEISVAFLSAFVLGIVITQPLFLLWEHATAANWPGSLRWAIWSVWLLGALFVLTWYTVSMWRSSRRSFLLGKRFWPIAASLAAVLVPTAFAAVFVNSIINALMRLL